MRVCLEHKRKRLQLTKLQQENKQLKEMLCKKTQRN